MAPFLAPPGAGAPTSARSCGPVDGDAGAGRARSRTPRRRGPARRQLAEPVRRPPDAQTPSGRHDLFQRARDRDARRTRWSRSRAGPRSPATGATRATSRSSGRSWPRTSASSCAAASRCRWSRGGTPLPYPDDDSVHDVTGDGRSSRCPATPWPRCWCPSTPAPARAPRLAGTVRVSVPPDTAAGTPVRIKLRVDRDKTLHWWFRLGDGAAARRVLRGRPLVQPGPDPRRAAAAGAPPQDEGGRRRRRSPCRPGCSPAKRT